jgi:hypothetical protein
MNRYAKTIVAVLTAAATAVQTQFPGNHWSEFVTAAIGAFLVYLVPNTTKQAVIPPQVAVDVTPKVER